MEPTIISGMAAVLGSLVGGSATVATAWITQKNLSRRELVGAEIRKRELLYNEFIAECSRLFIDAYSNSLERPGTIMPAFALLNRIRLTSSPNVLEEADQVVRQISEQYFSPNLTLEELRELARSAGVDPLHAFSDACRTELNGLRHGL